MKLGITNVSQAAADRNLSIDPSKYPKYHVRQWALESDKTTRRK